MDNSQLEALRLRIMMPWQVQRGASVWAPWGKSGWSAVEVKAPQRKWAKGVRVKPRTGERVAEGKIPKDRLLRRDPKLKGKDRPELSPSEVFAHLDETKEKKPVVEKEVPVETKWIAADKTSAPSPPEKKLSKAERKARQEQVERLLDLFDDRSMVDDW